MDEILNLIESVSEGFPSYSCSLNAGKHSAKGNLVRTANSIDFFANSINPDEVAHNEPPHLDLSYLPSSL